MGGEGGATALVEQLTQLNYSFISWIGLTMSGYKVLVYVGNGGGQQ